MASGFFDQPILNSPYDEPTRHHALSADGQPLNTPPVEGRRKSELISPVPAAKKQGKRGRDTGESLDLFAQEDEDRQAYTLSVILSITHISRPGLNRSNRL